MSTGLERWPSRREHLWSVALRLLLVIAVAVSAAMWVQVIWQQAELDCWVEDGARLHRAIDLELAGTADRFNDVAGDCDRSDLGTALWWEALAKAMIALVAGVAARLLAERGYRVRAWRKAGPALAAAAGAAAAGALLSALALNLFVLEDGVGGPAGDSLWQRGLVVGAATVGWPAAVLLAVTVAYALIGAFGWAVYSSFALEDEGVSGRPALPDAPPDRDPDGPRPGTGICLSGGGVRSASFGLGALQRLNSRDRIVDNAQYLSAVSGGSYAAGAWTTARHGSSAPDVWAEGSVEEQRFRTRLNYLRDREGGLGLALATIVIGLLTNAGTLLVMLVLLARPLGWLVGSSLISPDGLVSDGRYVLDGRLGWPVLLWLAATLVVILLWAGLVRVSKRIPRWLRELVGRLATAASGVSVLLGLVMIALPFIVDRVPDFIGDQTAWARTIEILGAGGIAAAVLTVLRKPLGTIAPRLGGLLVVALVLAVGAEVAAGGAVQGWQQDRSWYVITAGLFALFYAVFDPDWWSLQPYYRARLRSAYATERVGNEAVELTGDSEPQFHAYRNSDDPGQAPPGPELIVCAAMNTSGDDVINRVGVPAYSFTFDPRRVQAHWPQPGDGTSATVPAETSWYAEVFERWDTPKLSIMTAVGMSGAAVSSAMGRLNLGSTNALLTLANLRLGLWMPNPLYLAATGPAGRPSGKPAYPRRRVGYLLKELFGVYDPADHHVNVTDGGHWENLGLVELLRRRCAEIYCFDGSGAGPGSLATLAEAITLAAQECGVTVTVDFSSLRQGDSEVGEPAGFVRDDVAVGRIFYPPSNGRPGEYGLLYYGKATLARASRLAPRLLAYKEKEARFPHHSTADQLFDTEQFETYRLLGGHVADRLLSVRQAALGQLGVTANRADPAGQVPGWVLSDAEKSQILAMTPVEAEALLGDIEGVGQIPAGSSP